MKRLLLTVTLLSLLHSAHADSGFSGDSDTIDRVNKCLMRVTGTSMLTPQEEAHRKVVCYERTRGMGDACEGSVASTMRLDTRLEGHYRAQCQLVSPR